MSLGKFSISLNVKDLRASRDFYLRLGFEILDDQEEQNWMILRHGETTLGLFQGMFDKNILTFHSEDVRTVQKRLKEQGIEVGGEVDEHATGPTHIMLTDPDGNPILIDQHDPDYVPNSPN